MASRKSKVEILLTAEASGFNATVNRATRGWKAFNSEMSRSLNQVAGVKTQLAGLAGAFAGFSALSEINTLLSDAATAAFGLESSLTAANRQFDVGPLDQWQQRLAGLNKELRIYSDTELQQAASRTVDMTKRLSLSADQMEEVIRRTADLSAGRTDLVGGIERVTAALRGEAEASEYLGLTLNETYVRSWYEANDATQGAWKNLDDLQKAQIRYQIFLEQSGAFAGRAADSVNTYAGAIQLVRKEIRDGIGTNDELTDSLGRVARVLRDNADELGQFAATVARGAAAVIEFIANNQELLINIAKWGGAFLVASKAVTLLLGTIRGLNAAAVILTGSRFIPWLASIGAAALSSVPGITALSGALGQFAVIGASGSAVYFAAKGFLEMREAQEQAAAAADRAAASEERLAKKLKLISEQTGVAINSGYELQKAIREGAIYMDKTTDVWKAGAVDMAKAIEDSSRRQVASTRGATEEMKKAYESYVSEVQRIQDKIADREKSYAREMRELRRSRMDESAQLNDLQKEGKEYIAKAKEIAAEAKAAFEGGDNEGAKKLFAEALQYANDARDVARDFRSKTGDSMTFVVEAAIKEAFETGQSVLKAQEEANKQAAAALDKESGGVLSGAFEKAQEELRELNALVESSAGDWGKVWEGMQQQGVEAVGQVEKKTGNMQRTIVKVGDKWVDVWQDTAKIGEKTLDTLQHKIDAMDGQTITVKVEQVAAKQLGGIVQRFAAGGRLAGYGGGDRIPALLEAGEFIIRKEAVRRFGAHVFDALNSLQLPRFATGGQVGPSPAAQAAAGGAGSINVTLNYTGSGTHADARRMAAMVTDELRRQYRGRAR